MSTNLSNSHAQGVIYKKTKQRYEVHNDGQIIDCQIAGRLSNRLNINNYSDPLAIGDRVTYEITPDGRGLITELLPRQNKLARRVSGQVFEQVIAANIDQVVPVFAAANPTPHWALLDRYLISAEAANLPALVCITKLDLVQAAGGHALDELMQTVETYRRIGYPVVLISAVTGEGLDELRQVLQDRVSVLMGKSGVGKSSLLNALQPGLGQRVSAISQFTGKGRHTTTHLQMFGLPFGGAIIDTPGMREYSLWDVDLDDLALCFPEMRPFIGKCKFGLNCQHDQEPGCAVRKAVTTGEISPYRYKSYMRLLEEL